MKNVEHRHSRQFGMLLLKKHKISIFWILYCSMFDPKYLKKLIMIKCIFCCVYSDMEKPDGPDEHSRGMLQELTEAQVLFSLL